MVGIIQTPQVEGRIKIHSESPAFNYFKTKLLEYKETHQDSVRVIDSDVDDYSFW